MRSSESIKLPFLGDTKQREKDASAQENRSKPRVRFLVGSEYHSRVVRQPLATAVRPKTETNSNSLDNRRKFSHATLQGEMLRLELQDAPKPRKSAQDNMAYQTSIRHAQEIIQEKNGNLRLLVKEQDGVRNEVAMADHTIMELKTRLAEANYSLSNTKDHEQSLKLEVGKLKHEKEKLKKRCENAVWERASRLRAKDEKISNVQAETNKTLKLCEEVTKRNQDLRERLEKREKVAFGLKTKFALMANWTTRREAIVSYQSLKSLPQIIQDNSEDLRSLEREQVVLRNEVGAALQTIAELRAQLADKSYSLRSSHFNGNQLRLEAGKLKHEEAKINQRCQGAMWETVQRLQVKNEVISNLRAEIEQATKRNKLAKKEHRMLSDHLEQREKLDASLRIKYSMTSNWTIRQAARPTSPVE